MIRLSRTILCLDWDKRHLRMVLAHIRRSGPALQAAHSCVIPPEVNPDEPEQMGAFIAQQIKRYRLSARQVLVDVPRDRAVINRIALPPTPETEVAEVVRFQAMKELPFPLEESELDFVVLQRDEKKRVIEVMIAAVLKKTLQRIQAICTAAGVRPARVGLRPYANLMALQQLMGISADKLLFVDVGATLSEIDIFQSQRLAFSRAASVELPGALGGAVLSDDSRILQTSDMDPAEARTHHALNDLLVEITRSLQAYRAAEPGAKVESVVIAGGTGIEPALRDLVAERFGVDCRLFDARAKLRLPDEDGEKLRGFTAALGLAWGLNRSGFLELDFLNPKRPVPRRAMQLRRARVISLGTAAAVACIGAYAFLAWQKSSKQLAQKRSQVANLRKEVKQSLELNQQVERVRDWEVAAVWPEELLRVSQAAVEPGEKMIVQQIRADYRNAKLEIRQVQADHFDVPTAFVQNLNTLQAASRPVYQTQLGTWTEGAPGSGRNKKFKGAVDITIALRDLRKHLDGAAQREKDRKKELREYR